MLYRVTRVELSCLVIGGVADRIYTPLPTYAERGRSAFNGVVIDGGEPPKWRALGLRPFGTGAWLT